MVAILNNCCEFSNRNFIYLFLRLFLLTQILGDNSFKSVTSENLAYNFVVCLTKNNGRSKIMKLFILYSHILPNLIRCYINSSANIASSGSGINQQRPLHIARDLKRLRNTMDIMETAYTYTNVWSSFRDPKENLFGNFKADHHY